MWTLRSEPAWERTCRRWRPKAASRLNRASTASGARGTGVSVQAAQKYDTRPDPPGLFAIPTTVARAAPWKAEAGAPGRGPWCSGRAARPSLRTLYATLVTDEVTVLA